jgi:hypothetical protein
MQRRIVITIIAPNPFKSTPFKEKVFPLHRERGEKRFRHLVYKVLQAQCRFGGMSLRSKREPVSKTPALASTGSLGLVLLDLNGGNFSLTQGLTGVYT